MSGFLVNKSLLDPTVTQYAGGTATFTLPQSGSSNATEVFVGGVPQIAGVDFNVTGTTLTLTTSAPAGANFVCARQYFSDGITGTPGDNTVSNAKMIDDAVGVAELSATGTASSSVFLRGDNAWSEAGGGVVVQVVQLYKTDVESQVGGGAGTFYDISGYALAITPTKAGSKILVDINPVIGNVVNYGTLDVQADIDGAGYAAIGAPDTAGSRTKGWIGNHYANGANGTICWPFPQKFLWSPSYSLTDVLTVKCRWSTASGTIMLNRSYDATDNASHVVATSSITLWEIN
jgi:hypothetical protein